MKTKAQIAMEYVIIIGFAFLTSMFMFILFYQESNEISSQITSKQVEQIAAKIANNADKIYYLGENSKTTLKISLPSNVINVTLANKEIVFNIRTSAGPSDVVKTTVANITGTLPVNQGIYHVTIQSKGDYVLINYT